MKLKYLNPYIAGVFLGMVLLAANFFSGRGLGASGAAKSVIVSTVDTVFPSHSKASPFYEKYLKSHPSPLKAWLNFEVLGIFLGALLSAIFARRVVFKLERPDGVTSKRRIIVATIGGILFGFGAQLGRGCASGAALSGLAVLSLGGIITMISMFGGAYLFAYFVRKLWI